MARSKPTIAGKPVIRSSTPGVTSIPAIVISGGARKDVSGGCGRRRFPVEMPAITLGETFPETHHHDVPKSCWRWRPKNCCAPTRQTVVYARRMRQDYASASMGAISMNLPAIFVRQGRCARKLARPNPRKCSERLEVLAQSGVLATLISRRGSRSRRHRALGGNCNDDGNGFHHDQSGRGVGILSSAQFNSGRGFETSEDGHLSAAVLSKWCGGSQAADILTDASFDNAIAAVLALSGSTNAVIHMLALAGRAGSSSTSDRLISFPKKTPVLAYLRPSAST